MPPPVYPALTIYAVPDGGRLVPVVASIGGFSLPIVDAQIGVDPNGRRHGTQAITATLTFAIGEGSRGIEVVESEEAIPELVPFGEAASA